MRGALTSNFILFTFTAALNWYVDCAKASALVPFLLAFTSSVTRSMRSKRKSLETTNFWPPGNTGGGGGAKASPTSSELRLIWCWGGGKGGGRGILGEHWPAGEVGASGELEAAAAAPANGSVPPVTVDPSGIGGGTLVAVEVEADSSFSSALLLPPPSGVDEDWRWSFVRRERPEELREAGLEGRMLRDFA